MKKNFYFLATFLLLALSLSLFLLSVPTGFEEDNFGPFSSFTSDTLDSPSAYEPDRCYDHAEGTYVSCRPDYKDPKYIVLSFLFFISLVFILIVFILLTKSIIKPLLMENIEEEKEKIKKRILLYKFILLFSFIVGAMSFFCHFILYWHASADLNIFVIWIMGILLQALLAAGILLLFKPLKRSFTTYSISVLILFNFFLGYYYLSNEIYFFHLLSIRSGYTTSLEAMSVFLISSSLIILFLWIFKRLYHLRTIKALLFFVISIVIYLIIFLFFIIIFSGIFRLVAPAIPYNDTIGYGSDSSIMPFEMSESLSRSLQNINTTSTVNTITITFDASSAQLSNLENTEFSFKLYGYNKDLSSSNSRFIMGENRSYASSAIFVRNLDYNNLTVYSEEDTAYYLEVSCDNVKMQEIWKYPIEKLTNGSQYRIKLP